MSHLDSALAPLRGRLTDGQIHQLTLAIRSVVGIEVLVWLTDVGNVDRDDAAALICWSARAMLHSAVSEPPPVGPARAD